MTKLKIGIRKKNEEVFAPKMKMIMIKKCVIQNHLVSDLMYIMSIYKILRAIYAVQVNVIGHIQTGKNEKKRKKKR